MNGKKAVLSALAIVFVLKLFFFDFCTAQGHSMEPAINDGDILVVSLLRYGIRFPGKPGGGSAGYLIRWAQPQEGEVVVFYTPAGDKAVKRCTALVDGQRFYAEGDNSLSSLDSRSYGAVPVDKIIGKVLLRKF